MNQEYIKAVTQLGRPIPGQSLTSDPDNPAPYERPPEFTSVHAASEFIFEKLIDEEVYPQMMGLLADDVPIMDIVRTTLFAGIIVTLILIGCGKENDNQGWDGNYTPTSYTINFNKNTPEERCQTGWYTYSANQFNEYCEDLKNHTKMRNCAKAEREKAFKVSNCPGEFK